MNERQAIEGTYWDCLSIYRMEEYKNPQTRQTGQAERLLQEGIPCALSRDRNGEHKIADSHGQVSSSYTLFCAPETPITAGDRLVVDTYAGQQLTLWAGDGFKYPSHAEIPVSTQRPA